MIPKPLKIAEIILLIVVLGVGGWWLMKKPAQVSPTPTMSPETANWQTYRNEEFGYTIKIPIDWEVDCSNDAYRKSCMFRSPEEIKDAEQHPERSSSPPASLTIFEVVDRSTLPDFGEKRSDVMIGENVFNSYEVRDSGFMYGLVHRDASFYFYGHDPQILSTFKFTN